MTKIFPLLLILISIHILFSKYVNVVVNIIMVNVERLFHEVIILRHKSFPFIHLSKTISVKIRN